jgi:hypothetical protein
MTMGLKYQLPRHLQYYEPGLRSQSMQSTLFSQEEGGKELVLCYLCTVQGLSMQVSMIKNISSIRSSFRPYNNLSSPCF